MRKKLYLLEKTSSGLKPIYRYWTDYLLSSTVACKHTSKFSRCLVEFPSKTNDELRHAIETFGENYPDDIDIHFQEEMVHFKYYASQFEDYDDKISASQSYELICNSMIQSTFPNVLTALRIYSCSMIANATAERTFSKLKILKNCHRSSMTQERLLVIDLQ